MGCRTAIRTKLYWAKWGSKARGPRLRNSANSNAHSSSCWLNLLKNLHTGIHHTQQIQVTARMWSCVSSVTVHVCIFDCTFYYSKNVVGECGAEIAEVGTGRRTEETSETESEKLSLWCLFSELALWKTHHEICFFTGSDRPSNTNWSPDGDLALCVVIFFSAHLPAQILDNLLAPGIPNPAIHPHSLHPCVSQHKTGV